MKDEAETVTTGILIAYPWVTYMWVFGLAIWGGFVSYLNKVRRGIVSRFSFTELIGELVTSGFIGFLTFLMCQSAGINELLSGVMIGISGHMGARAISTAEKALENWLMNRFGISGDNKKSVDSQ